jgi:hypothetical protein
MAGHWQTVREAADELGVAPETLTRRLRSGRPESSVAGAPSVRVNEDAPVPPPPAMPFPRPQPGAANEQPQPLPKPPLCTLPPARPLPPAGAFPAPARRVSDASAAAASAAQTYSPPRDRIDDTFLAAVEAELKEIRSTRANGFVPSVLPAAPAVPTSQRRQPTAPVLDMADPLHAQVQDSKKQIRSMWVGVGLLLLAVLAGVVWTTVRMDRAEGMITSLINQLDAERTLSASYKQEIGRLFQALTDTKANQSKVASQSSPQKDNPQKRSDGRLTSGK